MAAVTICSDFGAQKNKVWCCFHCFPIYFPWSDGTGCHDLRFLNVELSANFFTLLFHFIKRLLSSSSLSAIRVVSSACLRLLIFLPAILIPACASSSPVFLMMSSAFKLNKQGDNTQPWHTPFPIWNQSVFPCPVLTVASWPAYRFLKRQVRWSGIQTVHIHISTIPSLWNHLQWKLLSRVWRFATPWTLQSMEFSRPEYRSGWPFPSPGVLPNPGIEPRDRTQVFHIAGGFFTSWATREDPERILAYMAQSQSCRKMKVYQAYD